MLAATAVTTASSSPAVEVMRTMSHTPEPLYVAGEPVPEPRNFHPSPETTVSVTDWTVVLLRSVSVEVVDRPSTASSSHSCLTWVQGSESELRPTRASRGVSVGSRVSRYSETSRASFAPS